MNPIHLFCKLLKKWVRPNPSVFQTPTVCLVLGPEGWVGSVPRFEDGTNPFLCLVVWVEFILFFVWLEGLEKRDGVQL